MKLGKAMFLIHNIYYGTNTAFIGIHITNVIIRAYGTNAVTMFRFTNIIGALALSAPNIVTVSPVCNDPLVQLIKDAITTIVGVLTALGFAISLIAIVFVALMLAASWAT